MNLYSIEYAHIYTNQEINKEHEFSLQILRQVLSEIWNWKYNLVCLVDDYSFPDPSFDYEDLNLRLSNNDFEPSFKWRESQLIPYCDLLLNEINHEKTKSKLIDYIISVKKYPCSLFIATWYLIRLWKIDWFIPPELVGTKLINILPESFEPFENKAISIIKKTKYKDTIKNIENKYFDGRILY